MANLILRHSEDSKRAVTVFHFIGCTPESACIVKMLRRLYNEINYQLGNNTPIPFELEELIRIFPEFLEYISAAGGGVIYIDALNQVS